jgi:hypothetical protein
MAAGSLLAAACEDPFPPPADEPYTGPQVPDVSGLWKGSFFLRRPDGQRTDVVPVTAQIILNESDHTQMTVVTSVNGRGHFLLGTIRTDGWVEIIDQYDGQTWTTHERWATPDLLELEDYVFGAGGMAGGDYKGMNIILLNEHVREVKEQDSGLLTLF